jgi:glutamate dehydrogenase
MTTEVDRLVLNDNYDQTQAISVSYRSKLANLDKQSKFIKFLEKVGFLDRENEFLPSSEEIKKRKIESQHLTRPELCVLFGYSKIYLYSKLLASNFVCDKYFDDLFLGYFPKQMQGKFKQDLLNHKLKNEIVATCVTNNAINKLGITFIHSISTQTSVEYVDVLKAFVIASEILDLNKIWAKIESLDFKTNWNNQLKLFADIISVVESVILWILSNVQINKPVCEIVDSIKLNFTKSIDLISLVQPKKIDQSNNFNTKEEFQIASQLELFSFSQYALFVSKTNEKDLKLLIEVIFKIKNLFKLDVIDEIEIVNASEIDKLAFKTAMKTLIQYITQIASIAITKYGSFENWQNSCSLKINSLNNFVNDIKISGERTISIIFLLTDKIKQMLDYY